MKKNLIVLISISSLFMFGCGKKIEKTIIFDNFKINLTSKHNYQEIAANIIPDTPIIKQYIQETEESFANSIVIAKNSIKSEVDIESFVENNTKSMTKKLVGLKKPKKTKITIKCNDQKIKGIIQRFRIQEGKEIQYLNQLFLTQESQLYGISTMTLNKSENSILYKALKKASCL